MAIVPPAIPAPPIAIAPPPRYARHALVNAAPLNPAKFEPTRATAIAGANAPAVATAAIVIPAAIAMDLIAVFKTSFNSLNTEL